MRNLEGMPGGEEPNEEISPENIDLSGQPKEIESEEGKEAIKELIKEEQESAEQLDQLSFEKNIGVVEEQGEETRIQIKERDDGGILSRLSQKGNKFAGIVVLSLASFSAGCGRVTSASESSKLQDSSKVENISAESQERDETIIGRRRVVKSDRLAERVKENNEGFSPEINVPIIRGPETDSDDAGKQTYGQKEPAGRHAEEITVEENNEGFALGSKDSVQRGPEEILAEEYRLAHSKEKPIISRQAERRIMENFRHFIKSSNVVSLKDGSFAVDIGINRGADDRVTAETGDRPCYKVEPEDLLELERIRKEHLIKVNFALSKRPFLPAEVKEGIRKRTERSLERAIRYCEKIPEDQLPEEIKELRAREQEEIKNKKEKIIAKNKENKIEIKKSGKNRSEKTVIEEGEGVAEETSEQKLKRRIEETKEIRTRQPRETPAQKFRKITKF